MTIKEGWEVVNTATCLLMLGVVPYEQFKTVLRIVAGRKMYARIREFVWFLKDEWRYFRYGK